ncbi:unnamed protein product [Rhizoctonia solani]|uniref:Uncharacterized protein n=1 Tax=Rhizoctonia solani TaxID=456999 RepID=A0A8H3BYX3_9AGAM|nr:unnamed protein product [Rhizoctonia solani]
MLVHGALFFAISVAGIAQAGNTTCKTTSLDWFTQSVGETPCRTYERLRQLCSADYQVGNFRSTTPGDNCGGQPAACCCNSVAWGLSMLCMNCQYGVGSSINGDHGLDARAGTYGVYLSSCAQPTNKSLPNDVQTAVCQQNIKLPAFLYRLYWNTGDWFYEYTKGAAQLDISSGKNDTGICLTLNPSGSTTITAGTAATSQPISLSSISVGAIAGGVAGGVALFAAAIFLGFYLSKRQKNKAIIDLMEENKPTNAILESYYHHLLSDTAQFATVTPYTGLGSPERISTARSPPLIQPSVFRRDKLGLNAPNPPSRADIYRPRHQHLLSADAGSSSYTSGDSEVRSSAFEPGRSARGQLPPSYQARY